MHGDIRTARVSDIDGLVATENAVFETDRISRKSFRRLLRVDTAAVLVAAPDDEVAGYCVVLFRRGSTAARLYSIAIGAGREGRGLGRALLLAAESSAIARGCQLLRLEVRDGNRRAITLYERSGYRKTGQIPGYYADGVTALRYEKALRLPADTARKSTVRSGTAA